MDDNGRIPKDLMPDSLHLTQRGCELWAEAIEGKQRELPGEAGAQAVKN